LKNGASIAPVISSVQANMQNDLAAPQARLLSAAYLEAHKHELRAVDLELASFVCVTSIEALTHTAVLHSKMLSDEAIGALVDEATRLIVRYLQ
jgi:hypothetical protein